MPSKKTAKKKASKKKAAPKLNREQRRAKARQERK
jgi:hypothetical protein